MYDIFLIAYVGIMKGFNLRKIKVSMAKSQNMSLRLVLTDLVKPKKRKRVAKEIDQFGDKTDQPQSKTMKVVVNEHISPKKEKEVYKKENLGTIDEEKPTTENKDVNVIVFSI